MRQKHAKKLSLNKKAISKLNATEMNLLKGGAGNYPITYSQTIACPYVPVSQGCPVPTYSPLSYTVIFCPLTHTCPIEV
jgi:natural product precursor